MNSRKWDLGDVAIAVMVAIMALLAFKKLGGVDWTQHLAMFSFLKISGLLFVGAVCFFWFWAGAYTKSTADITASFGPPLVALAALVAVAGVVLVKASDALQRLVTIFNT